MHIIHQLTFTPAEWLVLIIFWLTLAYQLFFYLYYMRAIIRNNRRERKGKLTFSTEQPPVSIVICARDEAENLAKFLPEVLNQDYPDFEVIVVNDGGDEATETLLQEMKQRFSRLRSSFVPNGATNMSTKKLALTLGIKAANHEWLLLTDADCIPASPKWIASMARNFLPGVDFVLGYGPYFERKGFLNLLIGYDTLFNAMQYLGFAQAGFPYMGVGRNLAYRKSVFFEHKGFASNLHLRSGDDDLLVNRASHKQNTRVETSPDSITLSVPKSRFKSWFYQKERHLSVSVYYHLRSRIMLSVEPITRGVYYLAFLAGLLLTIMGQNFVGMGVLLITGFVRLLVRMLVINRTAASFSKRRYTLSMLVLDIFLPLVTAFILMFGKVGRKSKYIQWK